MSEAGGAEKTRREGCRVTTTEGLCGAMGSWGLRTRATTAREPGPEQAEDLGTRRTGLVLPSTSSKKTDKECGMTGMGPSHQTTMMAPVTTACHRLRKASVKTRPAHKQQRSPRGQA